MPQALWSSSNGDTQPLCLTYSYSGSPSIPANGTSGTLANVAGKGDMLFSTTNNHLYINTGTLASPTWTQVV